MSDPTLAPPHNLSCAKAGRHVRPCLLPNPTLAETPTEVCVECQRLTVTGHGTFPYAGGHTLALHARIRELEATLRFIATEWDLKPSIKELRSRAKAALARSEEKP